MAYKWLYLRNIYYSRHKSEVLNYLQKHYQLIKIQINKTIKVYELNVGIKLINNIIKH